MTPTDLMKNNFEAQVKGEQAAADAAERLCEAVAEGSVAAYGKIESRVVGAYQKIEKSFLETFLLEDGETAEDAKARLQKEQKEREEAAARRIHHDAK